eukprot:3782838-Pyramimonas_sp.AAC.2
MQEAWEYSHVGAISLAGADCSIAGQNEATRAESVVVVVISTAGAPCGAGPPGPPIAKAKAKASRRTSAQASKGSRETLEPKHSRGSGRGGALSGVFGGAWFPRLSLKCLVFNDVGACHLGPFWVVFGYVGPAGLSGCDDRGAPRSSSIAKGVPAANHRSL